MRVMLATFAAVAVYAEASDSDKAEAAKYMINLYTDMIMDLSCEDFMTIQDARDFCGQQTAHAAKCMEPCWDEAQVCLVSAGNNVLEMQSCMLSMEEDARSADCNDCINEQIEAQCDQLFECIRKREEYQAHEVEMWFNEVKFESFMGYKKFCQAWKSKEDCTASGCNMNSRGCTAKYGKTSCGRIMMENICNAVPGCSLRKNGANSKGQICQGKAVFPEVVKKNKGDGGR